MMCNCELTKRPVYYKGTIFSIDQCCGTCECLIVDEKTALSIYIQEA